MTLRHQVVAIAAHCFICGANGVIVLEKHLIAECELPDQVKTICGRCGTSRFGNHHHHQAPGTEAA